jgi:DNA invertase Pin-like site-specific DNA recombinase
MVRTYADPGKSGLIAKNRKGLNELLRDVITGHADYKAILVYDVIQSMQNNESKRD